MPFIVSQPEKLSNSDDHYCFSPKHRSKSNPNASVWIISLQEEFHLCDDAIFKSKYVQPYSNSKKFAYNLKRESNKLKQLGVSNSNTKDYGLIISKFINDMNLKEWHGYPADYIANTQDKPDDAILLKMKINGLITAREMMRIKRGIKI